MVDNNIDKSKEEIKKEKWRAYLNERYYVKNKLNDSERECYLEEKRLKKEQERIIKKDAAYQRKKIYDKKFLKEYMKKKYKMQKIEKLNKLLSYIDNDTLIELLRNDTDVIKLSKIEKMINNLVH